MIRTHARPARRCSHQHLYSPRRGAAFLLAVYFTGLMLLTLGGVALQRTMTDVRAAQLSTQLAQSYWGSEAAYDQAFNGLRAGTLPSMSSSSSPCPVRAEGPW